MLVYLASKSLLLIYLAHCFFECLSLHWCIFMKLILSIFFSFVTETHRPLVNSHSTESSLMRGGQGIGQ